MFHQLVHEGKLSLKCSTHIGIYGFVESKSKPIGFYVVGQVHFIGTSVYGSFLQDKLTEICP